MTNILNTLANLRENDQRKFLAVRTNMRSAYLNAIHQTVGMNGYEAEDDTFLDAIDIKVEMLMRRAGISTPTSDNNHPEVNMADNFALITRPVPIAEPEKSEATKALDTIAQQNGWDTASEVRKVS